MALTGPYDTAAEALATCAGSGGGSSGDCPACTTESAVNALINGGTANGNHGGTWVDEGGGLFTVQLSVRGGYVWIICGAALSWDGIDGGGMGTWVNPVITEGPPASLVYTNAGADTASQYGPGGTMADPVTSIVVTFC